MKKLNINNLSLNNLSLNKSSIKKQTLPFAILSLTAASVIFSPNAAASELSANVGFTSNYLWRGMEQTGGDAAVSGGIDFSNDSGFYVGTWASNASWAPGMTYELDFYGGFAGKLSESVEYDIGFIYYAYPDETSGNADFSEIYGSVSFDTGLSLGLAVLVDGEGADAGDTLYASADYEFTVGNDATVNVHLGSYSGDWLAEDMIEYGVSLSKSGFTFGVSDTDMDGDDVKVYVSYSMDIEL